MTASEQLQRLGKAFDHIRESQMDAATLSMAGAALEMIQSEWWTSVPAYEEPKPVSGEIPWR